MNIEMNKLSCDEQKAVKELQIRMKSILKPKMCEDVLLLYRFLKARDFDVNAAEIMLQKHVFWRKLYQVDTILEDFKPKEFFRAYAEPSPVGIDKDGCLILYSPAGNISTEEALKCEIKNKYKKYWIWFAEKCVRYADEQIKAGANITKKGTFILDLDKLTFGNATSKASIELFLFFADIYQNNYPEFLKAMYVINAPAYYAFVFSILKAILASVVVQKIHVFSRSGWKEKLLEVIDADVLPEFLGGNRTDIDGDPMCRSFVCHGGEISPNYFLSNEERYFTDRTRVTEILVPNKKKIEIAVDVKELKSLIQWEFYTKSNIGFGLFYCTTGQELEEVIPIVRYSTSDGTERDSYKVRSIGKYIIIFDNSYSHLSSKEVEYCIKVISEDCN